MSPERMQARIAAEPEPFQRYAAYMLEEEPDLSLPMLRELYKYNASAREYRAHMDSIKSGKAVRPS